MRSSCKASCQVNISVWGCQSAVFSPVETRLKRDRGTQLLPVTSGVLHVSVQRARGLVFFCFFPFTLTRASPRVGPPHRMSLFRPDKFWIFQVSQLIVRFHTVSHATLLTFLKAAVWWKFRSMALWWEHSSPVMEEVFKSFISLKITTQWKFSIKSKKD